VNNASIPPDHRFFSALKFHIRIKLHEKYDYGIHGNESDFKMQWEPEAKQE
jgi:hypothetical protein